MGEKRKAKSDLSSSVEEYFKVMDVLHRSKQYKKLRQLGNNKLKRREGIRKDIDQLETLFYQWINCVNGVFTSV